MLAENFLHAVIKLKAMFNFYIKVLHILPQAFKFEPCHTHSGDTN